MMIDINLTQDFLMRLPLSFCSQHWEWVKKQRGCFLFVYFRMLSDNWKSPLREKRRKRKKNLTLSTIPYFVCSCFSHKLLVQEKKRDENPKVAQKCFPALTTKNNLTHSRKKLKFWGAIKCTTLLFHSWRSPGCSNIWVHDPVLSFRHWEGSRHFPLAKFCLSTTSCLELSALLNLLQNPILTQPTPETLFHTQRHGKHAVHGINSRLMLTA